MIQSVKLLKFSIAGFMPTSFKLFGAIPAVENRYFKYHAKAKLLKIRNMVWCVMILRGAVWHLGRCKMHLWVFPNNRNRVRVHDARVRMRVRACVRMRACMYVRMR